jgi:hypothetical protein
LFSKRKIRKFHENNKQFTTFFQKTLLTLFNILNFLLSFFLCIFRPTANIYIYKQQWVLPISKEHPILILAEEESLTCATNSPNLILALLAVAWEVNWGRANCHLWEESHLVSVKVVVNAVKELKESHNFNWF